MKAYTWEQLRTATVRRQFPRIRGRGPAAVAELVRRVGPIQSQVARAPFVTVSSRLPGASYVDIVAAYESGELVRGSNLRGTVHTCVREHHPLLDAVTRRVMEKGWIRNLRLERTTAAEVQTGIEEFATGEWRTPDELREHLVGWLRSHEGQASADVARTSGVGRAFAHVHSGLVRRPAADAGWDRQTTPGYRKAAEALGDDQAPIIDDPEAALVAVTRQHLTVFGPANRRDIAWWSGAGLRQIDQALVVLGEELTERPGPDGQTYYDHVDAPGGGWPDPGVRLLPEFDAVLVGYDPKTRERFLEPEHLPHVWQQQNGLLSSGVLSEGRLVASWRLEGTGDRRRLEVLMFPGQRLLADAQIADQVSALETALAIHLDDVRITTSRS